jgi:hypothetical protein
MSGSPLIRNVRYLGADGVETFTRRLVEENGVLLLPSSVYRSDLGPVPADRFRIGFGRSTMPAGLAAMRDWLSRNAPMTDTLKAIKVN